MASDGRSNLSLEVFQDHGIRGSRKKNTIRTFLTSLGD